MTTDEPSTIQPQTADPTIIELVTKVTSPWLKPLIERRFRGRARANRDDWPPRSPYLTDGQALYRVAALLDVPVTAIVLEDCASSSERLCTRTEWRGMGLHGVS